MTIEYRIFTVPGIEAAGWRQTKVVERFVVARIRDGGTPACLFPDYRTFDLAQAAVTELENQRNDHENVNYDWASFIVDQPVCPDLPE